MNLSRQLAESILMVRPAAFGFNAETATNNFFQQQPSDDSDLQLLALKEFDAAVEKLKAAGIDVHVIEDTALPIKPDAIFPNNWLNAANGMLNVFPMHARSRREEKRNDILEYLASRFQVSDVRDWSEFEADALYLEGTGSMVIDHENSVIYACLSPRTYQSVVEKFAASNHCRVLTFQAFDNKRRPVYHTNVMMSIGEGFAVLCPKSIEDNDERVAVSQLLEHTGHDNIYIEPEQMESFAGNILHVKNGQGDKFIVMGNTAFNSFTPDQKQRLANYGELLVVDIPTIERVEGGSIRCMMAEILLEKK
jgi:hypothetical protein